jgi:hypothetical protein
VWCIFPRAVESLVRHSALILGQHGIRPNAVDLAWVESYTLIVKADAGGRSALSIQVLTRIAIGGVIHMAFIHDDFHAAALTPWR